MNAAGTLWGAGVAASGVGAAVLPLVVLLAGWASPGVAPASESEKGNHLRSAEEMVWRSERTCGANCVYLLLRVHHIEADYRELVRETVAQESETSLTQLKRSAEDHGLPCRLRKTGPEGLRALPMPVVAHLDLVGVRGESGGHFVVVLRADDNGLTIVDGTTADTRITPWRDFERRWSGYVMYVSRGSTVVEWAPTAAALAAGALLGYLAERGLRRRAAPT